MTTAEQTWTESTAEVAGLSIRYLQGGSGPAAVVLHHSTGNLGWIPFYEALAQNFTVTVPDLPGYGQSERPVWARDARDIAILISRFLAQVAPDSPTLIGLGFGGFIAAELAAINQERIGSLVLVGAAGLQPDEGEILDQMLVSYGEYVSAGFRDEAHFHEIFGEETAPEVRELWDFSREMTARLSWKPYMFNRRLGPVLGEVQTPALVVAGSEEQVIPLTCARQYADGLANATLEIVEGAGHYVDYEEPEALAALIASHAGS
ncbi:MAG: alpha/beta hydrolase [Chloroflexi bacterium]|nr:alpha/beta hydrolase [Chloroflexota bacterium]